MVGVSGEAAEPEPAAGRAAPSRAVSHLHQTERRRESENQFDIVMVKRVGSELLDRRKCQCRNDRPCDLRLPFHSIQRADPARDLDHNRHEEREKA